MALPNNARGQIQALLAEAERASSSLFSSNRQGKDSSTFQLLLHPPLPAILAPLPGLFRLLAFLVVAPVIFVTLVDFAGYAVFRTLGEWAARPASRPRNGPCC